MGNVTVFKSRSELLPNPPQGSSALPYPNMQADVDTYWGSTEAERWFLIPFWKVEKLMNQSTTKEIALRITDRADKNNVDGTWVSFNNANPVASGVPAPSGPLSWLQSLLQSLQQLLGAHPDYHFYVLGENLFPLNSNNGFKFFEPHHEMAVVARIGKDSNDKIGVFFTVGQVRLRVAPGTSGGATSGARIPADGDPDN